MSEVITRFAPSPTGNPHVGNIRTALFEYLFAKSQKGKLLLRIEDTDRARFIPESLAYIEESLKWLGIECDGEKVFQSDRLETYKKYAEQLTANGFAYKCYCTTERLAELRKEQESKKLAPGYDGHCRNLCKEEIEGREKKGDPYVIRFKMPDRGSATWTDLVRGKIEIEYKTQEDPIILKSDGWPTYHLANICDDHEMQVTDVIRGEEWIPSTPKHIAIYNSLGWEVPTFAHLPVILGPDKTKLSKRHGDTAILDYREKGYLPEAMVNFLALLGWNPGSEQEIFSLKELTEAFSIERVGKAPAVFDIEKLNWLNGQYIRQMANDIIQKTIQELYPKAEILKAKNFDRILEVEKTRLTTLSDILVGNEYLYTTPKVNKNILVFKKSNPSDTKQGLLAALETLSNITAVKWSKMSAMDFEAALKKAVEAKSLSNGDVFWPVRVALSGLEKSPSPAELLWVLGQNESIARIKKTLELFND